MRCQSIRLAASSTGSSSATLTRSVVISCSMVTKLWRHCPPSSRLAGVHSATGEPARWRATIAAVRLFRRWPAVPWLRIALSEPSTQREPV